MDGTPVRRRGVKEMKTSIEDNKGFYRAVLAIMLPVALQQAINMGVNLMDTIMLGSFGEAQLSASNLANQYYNFFSIFCMGIIGGASVLAAQYWGSRDLDRVREAFCLAIRLGFFLSVFFMVITLLFPAQIMRIYTPDPEVIAYGVKYLRVTAFIFTIHGTGFIAAQMMRSVGQARLGLLVSCISFSINLFANYVFIFGKFGAPQLEIAGAALGTLIARIAEFVVTYVYILVHDKALGFRLRHLLKSPSKEFFKSYWRLGAPVLVSDALLGLGGTMVSIVLGHMGKAVVAANSICQVIDRLCTVINSGVSNAASIITGNTVGKGNRKLAMEQGKRFFLFSVAFGAFGGVLVYLIGPLSIGLYDIEPETVELARTLMNSHAVIMFFMAIQNVMTKGVLRGGGDTKYLMKADVLFMWTVAIPLGAVGGLVLRWAPWITILCLRSDFIIKSFWCLGRLRSGKWIHMADGIEEMEETNQFR